MGQKVNPHGARVGVIKDWSTRWYADKKNFADNLVSDAKLRKMIKNLEFTDSDSNKPVRLYDAGVSAIDIERRFDNDATRVTVTVNERVSYTVEIRSIKKGEDDDSLPISSY